MKFLKYPIALTIVLLATSFSYDPWIDYSYEYEPIFMERSALEQSVSYKDGGQSLERTGKIYYKEPYIYVSERYKGVHVIDNTDPSDPVAVGFIVAPGCIDMAVKGDIMYLDNSIDLVAFDLVSKTVTKRIKDVFPEPISPDNRVYYGNNRPENYVIVGWEKVSDKQ